MARNKETPLTFSLPDGDSVDLCTWEYIESILKLKLGPTITSISDENEDLQKIDGILETWEKQSNNG